MVEPYFIEITKRYARLANGNVGNFHLNCKASSVMVYAYSMDFMLSRLYKVFPKNFHSMMWCAVPRFFCVYKLLWCWGAEKVVPDTNREIEK